MTSSHTVPVPFGVKSGVSGVVPVVFGVPVLASAPTQNPDAFLLEIKLLSQALQQLTEHFFQDIIKR